MTKGKVTLIGIGRLGICSALVFERGGYEVLGVDVFPQYVEMINNKTFCSHEPEVNEYLAGSKNFKATTSLEEGVKFSDLIFVCVDTPSTSARTLYDYKNLSKVLQEINSCKPSNKHVMIMCTVLPGYIREIGRHFLEDCINTTLNYNPEFIAQGAIISGFRSPDLVLLGVENKEIEGRLKKFYEDITENQPYFAIMSPESAELMKISLNCFVTTKIAYANMIADIADRTPGANKYDILDAIGHDTRVGTKYLKPGYSFGGPCFPRDNRALFGYANQVGIDARISEATEKQNQDHIDFQFQELLKQNKDVYEFVGIGYKDPCDVPIIEESAKLIIAEKLARAGKRVILKDQAQLIEVTERKHGKLFEYVVIAKNEK
jgi:nucleotide sugar dehydrogenase